MPSTNVLLLAWSLICFRESSSNTLAYNPVDGSAGIAGERMIYIEDVNTYYGTDFKSYHRFDPKLSFVVYTYYMQHWATKARLGREATIEDVCRIHNGGPKGWKRKSTKEYWRLCRKNR